MERFDELIDVVDVKCLHDEGIDYSPRLANLGQFIRFMVVRTFLDLTNQWDSESTYPFLVLSRMAYDTKAVVQKVKPITLSLFFTIKRVYAMYNTIFWRTQWNYYTHRNEYGIVQRLEKGFDHQAFQVFKKYEPYLQFFLVDGVATEGMLEAIPHIEKAYCYTKGSYGKDGWKSSGKDDGTWKSPDAYVGKKEGGSEHKDTWSKAEWSKTVDQGADGAQGSSSKVSDANKVDKESGGCDQQDNSKAAVDTEGTPGYGGSSCSKDSDKWDVSWTTTDPKFTPSTKGQEQKKSSNYGEYESKCDYPEGQNWRLADTTKPLEKRVAEELAVLEAAKSDAVRKLTEGDDFKSVEGDDDVEKKVRRRRHSKKKDKKKKRRSRHRRSRRRYYSDDDSSSSSSSPSSSSSD